MLFYLLAFFLVVRLIAAACTIPIDANSVYDACAVQGITNNTVVLNQIASYLSTNATTQGGVASLLNVASVVAGALVYSGAVLPTTQNVTVVEALTVDGFISTNTSVPPYTVDLAQLTAAANFPLDPTTGLPLLTQPYAGQYAADWAALLAQLTIISTTLSTISTSLNLGLTTQVPLEVNNDGTYAGRMYKTVQLSDLVYTALFQPNVVLSDHTAGINVVNSQPIVSAFITPYLDPPALGYAGTILCNTSLAGATQAPAWPFGVSYGGNDQVVQGTLGLSVTNGVTGLTYESVSTCKYGTNYGSSLAYPTKTSYGLVYGGLEYTAKTGVVWPYCYSSNSCGGFMALTRNHTEL